jgi:hypothetical protein
MYKLVLCVLKVVCVYWSKPTFGFKPCVLVKTYIRFQTLCF